MGALVALVALRVLPREVSVANPVETGSVLAIKLAELVVAEEPSWTLIGGASAGVLEAKMLYKFLGELGSLESREATPMVTASSVLDPEAETPGFLRLMAAESNPEVGTLTLLPLETLPVSIGSDPSSTE